MHHSAMPARRVQLADVAARSGVSVSTASYVLSGKDGARRFNEGTRRRVVEAARDLGYVRNRSARSLRQGRTRTVALFYEAPMDRFVERYQLQAVRTLRERGYLLVAIAVVDGEVDTIVEAIRSGMCDGALVACSERTGMRLVAAQPTPPLPVLLLGATAACPGYDVVMTGEPQAVEEALASLWDAGARRILFAGQHRQEEQVRSDLRWQAYARFMGAHSKEPGLLMTCAPDVACAYQQAVAVLREARDRDALPDAVYCAADRTATGVVLAAQHLGIPVPARMSVLGTGNSQDAEYLDPPLSTIGMTQASIAAVLEHFWSRLSDDSTQASAITERWRLVPRGTTPAAGL